MSERLQKILGYVFTPFHLVFFGSILVVFDVLQRIALAVGGYRWHKASVDLLNWMLAKSLLLLGSRVRFNLNQELPTDRPLIVVANHQSMHDIPPFFWYLRKHHVKFISKIELAHGIPSISYNLRHGGSVVIDRKQPRQAIPAIHKFAQYIEANNYCAVIFPEGTRSRTGKPRPFNTTGFKTLLKQIPSAIVLPVTINQTWKLNRYGWFPMPFGVQPVWDAHPYIDPRGRDMDEVVAETEALIKGSILIPAEPA